MKSIAFIIQSYREALKIISIGNLKKFYFLPGIIGLFILMLLYNGSNYLSFSIYDYLGKMLDIQNYGNIALILIKLLIITIGFLVYFLIYKSLILIILSPFLSYISEKTERIYRETDFNFSLDDNIRFILRGILVSSRAFIFEIIGTILIVLLGFIPVVNIFSPIFLFLLQSYFSGIALMDYTLERRKFSHRESANFVRKYWIFSTLNGIIFTFIFLIPIIGIFIAPLLCTVAITIGTIKVFENEK